MKTIFPMYGGKVGCTFFQVFVLMQMTGKIFLFPTNLNATNALKIASRSINFFYVYCNPRHIGWEGGVSQDIKIFLKMT